MEGSPYIIDEEEESDEEPDAKLSARDRDLNIDLTSPAIESTKASGIASASLDGRIAHDTKTLGSGDGLPKNTPRPRARKKGSKAQEQYKKGASDTGTASNRRTDSILEAHHAEKSRTPGQASNGDSRRDGREGPIASSSEHVDSREDDSSEESVTREVQIGDMTYIDKGKQALRNRAKPSHAGKITSKRRAPREEEDADYQLLSDTPSDSPDSDLLLSSDEEPILERVVGSHEPPESKRRRRHISTTRVAISSSVHPKESKNAINALLDNEKRSWERLERKAWLTVALQERINNQKEALQAAAARVKHLEAKFHAQSLKMLELRTSLHGMRASRPLRRTLVNLPHVRIRNMLTLLFNRLEIWVSTHALSQPLPALTIESIKTSLALFDDRISGLGMDNWALFDLSRPHCRPSMALYGLLASKIVETLFDQAASPWFLWRKRKIGFPDKRDSPELNASLDVVLGKVRTLLNMIGETKGEAFRAGTVAELLGMEGGFVSIRQGSGSALKGYSNVITLFAADLLKSVPVRYLLKGKLGQEAMSEFVTIMEDFVGLAARTWTARIKVEVLGMTQILDFGFQEVNSRDVEGDLVSAGDEVMDVVEGLECIHGSEHERREVGLVVRPGIVVHDISEDGGTQTGRYKVWSKMAVWVCNADEQCSDERQIHGGNSSSRKGKPPQVRLTSKNGPCSCGGAHDSRFWRFRFGRGRPLTRCF